MQEMGAPRRRQAGRRAGGEVWCGVARSENAQAGKASACAPAHPLRSVTTRTWGDSSVVAALPGCRRCPGAPSRGAGRARTFVKSRSSSARPASTHASAAAARAASAAADVSFRFSAAPCAPRGCGTSRSCGRIVWRQASSADVSGVNVCAALARAGHRRASRAAWATRATSPGPEAAPSAPPRDPTPGGVLTFLLYFLRMKM